ncbi:hypothetical protein RRG08_024433 [Elysia crispata]|uniref:Uncharacterized protein n=1 Tax=Elysia crispata TaxID=231223 RepID=A0AAE0YPZ7_9GAST|nr:hypothetical protein RRG08_024433 [Elysia crispata]
MSRFKVLFSFISTSVEYFHISVLHSRATRTNMRKIKTVQLLGGRGFGAFCKRPILVRPDFYRGLDPSRNGKMRIWKMLETSQIMEGKDDDQYSYVNDEISGNIYDDNDIDGHENTDKNEKEKEDQV